MPLHANLLVAVQELIPQLVATPSNMIIVVCELGLTQRLHPLAIITWEYNINTCTIQYPV